ncbi:GerAB/ArcD/ProY family transporter [Paenibacillus harenae]|uniref:Spore germination protein KB n=1 Tax=Paenibacillus harenae TaxID=306543 RepID=A0ABT9U7Y2_PAEHA|nr:endospore germination permease [Paenibacillus harenae]MDQ0115683.1 spore germination protein KB [Paenibacillus harenae]
MRKYDNGKITIRQFTILIVLGTIGDSILVIPTLTANFAKQDAWISMLLSFVPGLATAVLYGAIASKLQGKGLIFGAQQTMGKWIGSLVGLLFLFYFFFCHITLTSEMSQFLTTQMMPETPVNAIIIVFMTVVIIIAYRYGVEAFARMGELLFPIFVLLFAFLIVLLLPQVEMSNLKPIMAKGFMPAFEGMSHAYAVGFNEMIVLLMIIPRVAGGNKMKPILTGFAIGGAVLFITVFLCVLVLGTNLMETKYYPTYVLAQKINIGNFLERMEAILAFIWIITVYFKTLLYFYALVQGIAVLMRLKESDMLTIPLGMLVLVCTVVVTPSTTSYYDIVENYWPWFDLTFCVALPLLLLCWIYAKGNNNSGGNTS